METNDISKTIEYGVKLKKIKSKALNKGRSISLQEARNLIKHYQSGVPEDHIKSLYIDADFFRELLLNKNCEYIRFFFGKRGYKNDKSQNSDLLIDTDHTIVVVGVDKNGKNMISQSRIDDANAKGEIYDDMGICPSDCHGGDGENLL